MLQYTEEQQPDTSRDFRVKRATVSDEDEEGVLRMVSL
jgi:hypothetical protein